MRLSSILIIVTTAVAFSSCGSQNSYSATVPVRLLILGNSITEHGPLPEQKWFGEWGMAASSESKDYVHVLLDSLHKRHPGVKFDFIKANIAYWEKDFNYDFGYNKAVTEAPWKPDILIIRLGENCDEGYARQNGYDSALKILVARFATANTRVIITGNFWPSPFKDSVQEKVARDNNYAFVPLADLSNDPSNKAIDVYGANSGVGMHPGDKGMNEIATRILKKIESEHWIK